MSESIRKNRLERARALVYRNDLEGLRQFLEGAKQQSVLGLLLIDAIEAGADDCFQWLLDFEEIIELGGGEALGTAGREGRADYVEALLAAGADTRMPEWEPESDWDNLLTGAMLSMNSRIMELACEAGAVDTSDPRWLEEAIEVGVKSKKKDRWPTLTRFGAALVDRLESGQGEEIASGVLGKLAKRLESRGAPEEAKSVGQELRPYVNAVETLREELTDRVIEGDFEKVLDLLQQQEVGELLKAEMLVWLAKTSGTPYCPDPDRGWWAVERLLEEEVRMDGVDAFGRTALIHTVWKTEGREDLIRKMIEKGANINAVTVDRTGLRQSVLDYSQLGFAPKEYGELLRSLGAKTAEELQAEDRES